MRRAPGSDPNRSLLRRRWSGCSKSPARVVCVLNRNGRARLLACTACGELARAKRCDAGRRAARGRAWCAGQCATTRPAVCLNCGATRFEAAAAGRDACARGARGTGRRAGRRGQWWPRARRDGALGRRDRRHRGRAPSRRGARRGRVSRLRPGAAGAPLPGRRRRRWLCWPAPPDSSAVAAAGAGVLVQTRVPDHEVIDAALHADPGRVLAPRSGRGATDLRFPPFSAMAAVSGARRGGPDRWRHRARRRGARSGEGRWLVRADTHDLLSDA